MTIFDDNEGDIHLSNPFGLSGSNYIYIRYNFIRHKIREGNVSAVDIKSSDQCAETNNEGLSQDMCEERRRYFLRM